MTFGPLDDLWAFAIGPVTTVGLLLGGFGIVIGVGMVGRSLTADALPLADAATTFVASLSVFLGSLLVRHYSVHAKFTLPVPDSGSR